jgi:hypothetical protein
MRKIYGPEDKRRHSRWPCGLRRKANTHITAGVAGSNPFEGQADHSSRGVLPCLCVIRGSQQLGSLGPGLGFCASDGEECVCVCVCVCVKGQTYLDVRFLQKYCR